LPLVGAMARASAAEAAEIRHFFTRVEPTDDEIARIIQITTERGGLDYARSRARYYADLAEAALADLGEDETAVDALRDAVSYAVDRSR
jgi:geranylgeranyl pyrophosphate synthase